MRGLHHYAMPDGLLVARDQLVLMEKLEVSRILVHADGLAHIGDRYRVARGPTVTRASLATWRGLHAFITIWRSGAERGQLFMDEAISRPSWVVPWVRRSATSTLQRSSQLLRSSHDVKRRPARHCA
jgi:hypothetical protein